MLVIFPSDSETGTLSTLAPDFEHARYYTIANIIEGTLADTKIKQGFASPPVENTWGSILARMKVEVVVAQNIQPGTILSLEAAGLRVIKGARGLVGDFTDWIADMGVDEVEEKIAALSKPPPAKQAAAPAQTGKSLDPVISKPSTGESPAGQQKKT